jgi:hypothetical protein
LVIANEPVWPDFWSVASMVIVRIDSFALSPATSLVVAVLRTFTVNFTSTFCASLPGGGCCGCFACWAFALAMAASICWRICSNVIVVYCFLMWSMTVMVPASRSTISVRSLLARSILLPFTVTVVIVGSVACRAALLKVPAIFIMPITEPPVICVVS